MTGRREPCLQDPPVRRIDAALDEARAKKRAALATLAATRAQHVATEAALQQSKSDRARAEDNVGQEAGMNARLAAAEAAVRSAELDLEYTRVQAPFNGRVVNLNISIGAFARAGTEVFTLVDIATWYVMANFRETQLHHILPGMHADVYVLSRPTVTYDGIVDSVGFGVRPDSTLVGTFSSTGLPDVQRSLNWVHLATRFPVRVRINAPESEPFRLSESAVVVIRGWK